MNDSVLLLQQEMLVNRVRKNLRRFRSWLTREKVTCYRLYNADIPEIPLLIDWYEGALHGARLHPDTDDPAADERGTALLNYLARELGVADGDLFFKTRQRGVGGALYPATDAGHHLREVREGGHVFRVNLSDYVDTGLFLDHRRTRRLVAQEAKNKRFLNLFGYTGAFSVYAAGGGARTTTTVDLSNTYLHVAQTNMERNGFTGFNHHFVRQDVLSLLDEGGIREKFDLVVFDPPTVSKSSAMKRSLVIQRDHAAMLNAIFESVAKGGVVYFSTNFRDFRLSRDIRAGRIEEITSRTVPPDFANRRPHRCWRMEK